MCENKTIKCAILDDEDAGIKVLQKCMEEHANLELRIATKSYVELRTFLNKEKIDLLFLDIHMPMMDGITVKSIIPPDIAVIFCSADHKRGSEVFEVDAFDYLNKPIVQDRFDTALARYDRIYNPHSAKVRVDSIADEVWIQLKKGSYTHILEEEIDYILITDGDVQIYCGEDVVTVNKTIKWFLERLSPNRFIQISQSAIVARNRIRRIDGSELLLRNHATPLTVTSVFKKAIVEYFRSKMP